jgi:hypothetical protein
MKYFKHNRRMFLQGAGSFLAIPFLPSLAFGQTLSQSPFIITIASNQCMDRYRTWSRNKTIPYTTVDADTKIRKLSDLAMLDGRVSEHIDAGWNKYLDKMNMFTHLSMYSKSNLHSESVQGCADNRQSGSYQFYSLDYLIQEHFKKTGFTTPLDHVLLNFNRTLFEDYTNFFHGGKVYSNAADNPRQLEQLIFNAANLKNQQNGGGTTPPPVSINYKGKLVDSVLADFNAIINGRKISSVDKVRLSNAIDMWNDIENNTPAPMPGSSQACVMPNALSTTNLGAQQRHAIDIIVASIACGVTRVVNHGIIPVGDDLGDSRYEAEVLVHEWAHGDYSRPLYGKFRADIIKYYAEKLSSVQGDNGKALIDNGLLFWTTEFSGFGLHPHHGRTVITLGNAGGKLKTGYQINGGNAPFQRAHITAMKAFGLSQAEIEVKGEVGFGEYESSQVSSGGWNTYEVDWEAETGNNQWDPEFTFNFGGVYKRFTTDPVERRKSFTGFLL